MKKKLKNNIRGFVLVETLITTVFVVVILSIAYINFYPLIGEYEKREAYDDVDSKYAAFWVKRMIQDSDSIILYDVNNPDRALSYPNSLREINCKCIIPNTNNYNNYCGIYNTDSVRADMCEKLKEKFGIKTIIVSKYNLTDLKKSIKEYENDPNGYSLKEMYKNVYPEFRDYIKQLPNYNEETIVSKNGASFRVLIEFEHVIKNGKEIYDSNSDGKTYNTFANMEVTK